MRKFGKLALVGLILCSASAVHAQSSVTLYGMIDEGILFNSNAKGGRQFELANGNLAGDRWGLLGAEDLGGGNSAIFRLEGGYNVNTGALGQGGSEFGRQAYVGLRGAYGTISLGRQLDALEGVAGFSFGNSMRQGGVGQLGGAVGAHPGDMDNLDSTIRLSNAIKYTSPLYHGFTFIGEYNPGGIAGDFSRNRIWSASASYSGAALSMAIGFEEFDDPNFSFYGNLPSSSSTGLNITTPVYSGYASARTQQTITGGVSYTLGSAVLGAVYSNVRFSDLGSVQGTGLNPHNLAGSAAFNIGELSLAYHVTNAWLLGGALTYTRGTSIDSLPAAQYKQIELASDYLLSKRTDVYTLLLYQHAGGYDSTLKPAVAVLNNLTPSSTNVQTAVVLGIRTRF